MSRLAGWWEVLEEAPVETTRLMWEGPLQEQVEKVELKVGRWLAPEPLPQATQAEWRPMWEDPQQEKVGRLEVKEGGRWLAPESQP